jgi:hypothetical protein
MTRGATGALLLTFALLAAGCTTEDPPERAADPAPTVAAPTPSPSPTAAEEPDRHPVVLAVHATTNAPGLTEQQARRVLRGTVPMWRVVAAPGMPVGPAVEVLGSAGAVRRAVERDADILGVLPARAAGPTVRALTVAGADPFTQPRRYPLTTDGPEPPRPTTLTVVGDLMLTRGVTDPAGALRPMAARLGGADLTVGNLENTLSRSGPPQQGGDSFGAEPEVVQLLAGAGFDAVSLANNHVGDFGEQALLDTVRRLRQSPVVPFGAGNGLAEAARPALLERHGVRFAFLGFNAIGETPAAGRRSPGALSVRMPPRTGPLSASDLGLVTRQVRRVADRADVVVVLPHWGTQYTHVPEPVQRLVGRRLVDAGASLVVGGHPHWVQGLDVHRGRVIAHSLGNFVFDMAFMTETQQGVVLEATFWGERLRALRLVPYRMDASFAPRPAAPAEARDILGDVWSTSTGPFSAPR